MNDYQDKYTRWHHKICLLGEPSSNNGWIYTAYAGKLGFELNLQALRACAHDSVFKKEDGKYGITRSPGDSEPPMSRDEVLGLVYCKAAEFNSDSKWNFCPYSIPALNLFLTLKALWDIFWKTREINKLPDGDPNKKPRDVLWKNGGFPHLFRWAFSVPLQDRASILRWQNQDVPWYYQAIEWFDKRSKSSSLSSELIRQLKYEKTLNKEDVVAYFGNQHPFYFRAYENP